MRIGKKGTEKPIEIFVALFVILAVSLVMLRLFQNQVTQQQDELQSFQQEQEQQQLLDKATSHCTQKCNQASTSGCSLRGMASLCLTYGSEVIESPAYLDLNRNQDKDVDTTQLAGIGLCEGNVPCHSLIGSCCDQQITAKSCEGILRRYWDQQGFNSSEIEDLFTEQWVGGTCNPNGQTMWWNQTGADVCTEQSCI